MITDRAKFVVFILVILGLIATGIWIERGQQAKTEVKDLRTENKALDASGEKLDKTFQEKVATEAKARQQLDVVFVAKREAKSEDETYRDYLDRPLPERTLRLYEQAGKIDYAPGSPDAADSGDKQKD